MPFDFPSSPVSGAVYQSGNGPTYVFTNGVWNVQPLTVVTARTAETRNRIVNGAMQVSQENGSTVSPATAANAAYYAADQWYGAWQSTGGTCSFGRFTNATYGSSGQRVQMQVNATNAAPAAGDYCQILQLIEGVRLEDFKWGSASAKQAVLTFTAIATGAAGTFSVAVKNTAPDRTFLAPFTLTAANVPQTFAIVIPGDTTGTWAIDNSIGLRVQFGLMAGSTYGGGVAGWQAGNKIQIAGNTNLCAVINNTFSVWDVGLYLDPNSTGTPPPWQMPDEAQELVACCRYYQKSYGGWSGATTNTISYYNFHQLPVIMRVLPNVTGVNQGNSAFPAAMGAITGISPPGNSMFYEVRVANATGSGLFHTVYSSSARM